MLSINIHLYIVTYYEEHQGMTKDEEFPQAKMSPLCSLSPYQRFSIPGILIQFRLKSDIPLSEKI